MDIRQLSKFFPTTRELDQDTSEALDTLYAAAKNLAETIQTLIPESATKTELQMRTFHVLRDAELALKLDGPSRVQPMIITNVKQ